MFTAEERLAALKSIFGNTFKTRGDEVLWGCRFCQQDGKDTHEDNFSFNTAKNVWTCVAVAEHGKRVSGLLREALGQKNPQFKTRKMKAFDLVSPAEMPQEIIDYWQDRKIYLETFDYFKVQYDRANIGMYYVPNSFQPKIKLLFHEEKNKSDPKKKRIGNNTIYPVSNKYEGQKKFLYLEGEPDVWCMHSNFPKEFFKEYYVATTLHGAAHIPALWKDPKFWDNYDEVYLVGDQDEAGKKAVTALKNIIGEKAKNVSLPFKHQRLVNGIEIHYTSKDFNDWIIEGGDYKTFLDILTLDKDLDGIIGKEVEEFLLDPSMFERYIEHAGAFDYIGETNNKAQVILENNSRLTKTLNGGLSSKGQAPTAVGKTSLYKNIGQNLFTEDFIVLTRITPKAMMRLPQDAWKYKIIMTEEDYKENATDSDEAELLFNKRIAKSEGMLTLQSVNKNTMQVETNTLEGPFIFQEPTTKTDLGDEDVNRDTVHHFDESAAQTERINKQQALNAESIDLAKMTRQKHLKSLHLKLQKFYKKNIPDYILIPNASRIRFPKTLQRARRDFPKLLRYIQVSAFIHQKQRKMISLGQYFAEKSMGHGSEKTPNGLIPANSAEQHSNTGALGTLGTHRDIWACPDNSHEFSTETPQFTHRDMKPPGTEPHVPIVLDENLKVLIANEKDIEIAMKYVVPDLVKEYVFIDSSTANRYKTLKSKFGVMENFTAKLAAPELGVSIKQARRVLDYLTDNDLASSEKDGKRYKYTLKQVDISTSDFGLIGFNKEDANVIHEASTGRGNAEAERQEPQGGDFTKQSILDVQVKEDKEAATRGTREEVRIGPPRSIGKKKE